jgi:hypothetical protein
MSSWWDWAFGPAEPNDDEYAEGGLTIVFGEIKTILDAVV